MAIAVAADSGNNVLAVAAPLHMGTCKPCGENVVNCLGNEIGFAVDTKDF